MDVDVPTHAVVVTSGYPGCCSPQAVWVTLIHPGVPQGSPLSAQASPSRPPSAERCRPRNGRKAKRRSWDARAGGRSLREGKSGFSGSIDRVQGVSQNCGEIWRCPGKAGLCSKLAGAQGRRLLLLLADELMFAQRFGTVRCCVCANGCSNCQLDGTAACREICERSQPCSA